MNYDEPAVLRDYVLHHCREFMTEVERRADLFTLLSEKASAAENNGSLGIAGRLRSDCRSLTDPAVEAALADGYPAFRERVARRLLTDPAVQAMINRCPRCHRVVRTPKVRQCQWCKHDWHEPAPSANG